ncbi:MAG: glycosyltransferase family 39 protein [Pelolinea sp.]|nr:glycosyltransferase family 39 protein [Pelolinea sp.]
MQNRTYWLWWAIIILAVVLGLVVRFYDLTDPPLDFHPTRQLHSVLIARGMYYQSLIGAPAWQREMAVSQWKAEGLIEPQIMERLTALTYRVIGSEQLWVARTWSIFFWTLGGVFLLFLAHEIAGLEGAAIAIVYYFLWPYAAIASRAFQPEPLMTAAIIIGLWAAVRWTRMPSQLRAAITGITCGLAIYIKSVAVFFIAPALAGLVFSNYSFLQAIKNRQVWLIGILSVLPYAIYHFYGVYVLQLLGEQFSLRFFPNLWTDPAFYLRWIGEMSRVIGLEIFLLALAGSLIFPKKDVIGLFIGLTVGYLLYGFTFSYHISTHDYYHIPLMVQVSLGLALVFKALVDAVDKNKEKYSRLVLAAILLAFMALKTWDVRVTLKRVDYRGEVKFWQNLSAEIGNDKKVTGLLSDYGYRLAYWGWMKVSPWMQTMDINLRELAGETLDYQEALEQDLAGNDLFVVTLMDEFTRQPQLQDYLRANYPIIKDTPEVIIFDLHEKP